MQHTKLYQEKISMTKYNISITQEAQFAEVIDIIQQHKSHASQVVNNEILLTAWCVGKYVSEKLKTEEWGSKVVCQLSEYIRSNHPEIKGFSRSSIYNMVMFYDEYSSKSFKNAAEKYLGSQIVQPAITQFDNNVSEPSNNIMKPTMNKQIVQMPSGQFPKILFLTTLLNHYDILGRCRSFEERLFYILYAHKERLSHKELQRAITTQTYETLLSDKNNMSKGLAHHHSRQTCWFFIAVSRHLLRWN